MEWVKDFLAVWGAGLSTLIAVYSLFQSRPSIRFNAVTHSGDVSYRLAIYNRSRHPILVSRVRPISPGSMGLEASFSVQGWDLRDTIKGAIDRGRLNAWVAPGGNVVVDMILSDDLPERLCLLISWRKQGAVILPTLPCFVYRRRHQLVALRDHPPEHWQD